MDRRQFIFGGVATTTGLITTTSAAWAKCGVVAAGCGDYIAPNGEVFKGNKKIPLTIKAEVCFPDFDLLNKPQWWSLGISSQNGYMRFIDRVLRGKKVVEREIKTRCVYQFVSKGDRILAVTPCRKPGWNLWLMTDPITNSGEYELREVASLRKYAFRA